MPEPLRTLVCRGGLHHRCTEDHGDLYGCTCPCHDVEHQEEEEDEGEGDE